MALMAKRVTDMKAVDRALARLSRAVYDRFKPVLDLIGAYGQNVLATARDPDLDLEGRGYEVVDL